MALLLSIFTPSYNRAYILPVLYKSLVEQTDNNFEWVIVDDGSSDNTENLVNGWIAENKVRIVYYKQENQGKHIAINSGVNRASGELFFIVDSDDSLTPDAVQQVRNFWIKKEPVVEISGIISYRQFPDGKLVGNSLPKYVKQCKLRDCISKYGSNGDKVVIYRTEILRRFPYPKFDGELFFGESYVFNQIDDEYDMLVMDSRIYNFDYQLDGLSQDFRKLYRQNPRGMQVSFMQTLKYNKSLRHIAHVCCLSMNNHNLLSTIHKVGIKSIIALPIGLVLYIKIFIFKVSDVKPFVGRS